MPVNQTLLNSFDFFRPYGRILENPKTGGSRELFLPQYNFKICYAVNFPKKHADFRGLQDMKFKLEFFFICPSTYEHMKLIRTSFKIP